LENTPKMLFHRAFGNTQRIGNFFIRELGEPHNGLLCGRKSSFFENLLCVEKLSTVSQP
jgi:hypothetical protein